METSIERSSGNELLAQGLGVLISASIQPGTILCCLRCLF